MSDVPLLEIVDLTIDVAAEGRWRRAVDGVSVTVARQEIRGLVGESGSGKTLTALAVMGLLSKTSTRVVGGQIRFNGVDLLSQSPRELRRFQGAQLAMVFQEPMSSLNPAFTVGDQISEVLRHHEGMSKGAARTRAAALLNDVGIPEPTRQLDRYPHEFSGGMRQRVMIAIALACKPQLLIADEPTTALDVTVQAQILDLIRGLSAEYGMAVLFISHDLGAVAELCSEVTVLYAGEVVESGTAPLLFSTPKHPYTGGLLASVHSLDDTSRLGWIEGRPPQPGRFPVGCRFHPRCVFASAKCVDSRPELRALDGRQVRCLRAEEIELEGRP
ncbi:ABC transporter ATP-binding protein [Pseudarthrobacter sp. fls2-241-R2A-168]|uniref:ABC transporter ATP-binding protein n=1 Tax=Pseudarthrobacter sp. fls2-241-R2A-168 TaxID=3040304 RepID=UPI00255302CE|nr:ABC transporter ATP-binding protein [Pseudarthrobacter sp. fls2-241-R2A-168]